MAAKGLIPLRRAIGWIAISVVGVLGAVGAGQYYYGSVRERRAADESYRIFALVQTGPEKEALKSAYLAELLNLCTDQPENLYAFDSMAARRALLLSPLIKSASVTTYVPGIVYVDYTARKPVAYVGDYANTAVDGEGVLIPSDPFFTPKRIPILYLGLPPLEKVWGAQVPEQRLALAFHLRRVLEESFPRDLLNVKQIDISRVDDSSFGQRQVILRLEEVVDKVIQPVTLRLNPDPIQYSQAIGNYAVLRVHLRAQAEMSKGAAAAAAMLPEVVVDMRIPHLAYLSRP